MRIDSHQHFWSIQRENDYGFLTPDAGVLYKDYLPEQLHPILSTLGIQYTILVQAAETIAETEWLLDLSSHTDFIAGVVGWVDFDSDTKTFTGTWERLRKHQKFIGVRPMLQDLKEDDWILRPNVIENLKWIAKEDFPFDILVYPRHLPYIAQMLNRVPGLRAVVDHLAKPQIRKHEQVEPWARWMEEISHYPNVYCKLSGMVTEADHEKWKKEDMVPYVQHVVNCFGENRVMYGSDWPVCLQAATYEQVYQLLETTLPNDLSDEARQAIFGENAARFYKLKR